MQSSGRLAALEKCERASTSHYKQTYLKIDHTSSARALPSSSRDENGMSLDRSCSFTGGGIPFWAGMVIFEVFDECLEYVE
jgi:hypothetical protein